MRLIHNAHRDILHCVCPDRGGRTEEQTMRNRPHHRPWGRHCLLAAALAAAGIAGNASAASFASAVLTGWTVTLTDLDLGDGVAPEIQFTNIVTLSSADAHGLTDSDSVPGEWGVTAANAGSAFAQAMGSTSPAVAMAGGQAAGDGNLAVAFTGLGLAYAEFTLSAMTGVTFTATFDGMAETTLGSDGVFSESALAIGQLTMEVLTDSGLQALNELRSASAGAVFDGIGFTGQLNTFSGEFSLSFDNLSATSVAGFTAASAYAYGESALPVPEPGTYLMLLAGLGVIGSLARRRQRGV